MLIIGLTGSIAMGKSTAGDYLAAQGVPLFNADDMVHELYRNEAVAPVGAAFPGVIEEGVVDRARLSELLLENPEKMALLERIVHPLVIEKRLAFTEHHRLRGAQRIVVDIPLLFEKHLQDSVDITLLMTAPADIQLARAMKRPGMTTQKFEFIRAHQMDDAKKRALADFVIDTSGSFEQTHRRLDKFLEKLHAWPGKTNKPAASHQLEGS